MGGFDPSTPDLAGVGEGFDGLPSEAAKMSVFGTFNAAAVAGLGADSLAHARHSHNDQACSVQLPLAPCPAVLAA